METYHAKLWKWQSRLGDIHYQGSVTFVTHFSRSTLLMGHSQPDQPMCLWRLPIPARWKYFLWLGRDRLLTNVRRASWGLTSSTACIVCGHVLEDLSHILRDSYMARGMWNRIVPNNVQGAFFSQDVQSWMVDNLTLI